MIDKTEEKEETMTLEVIGKDEMNLVEFPISLLSKRHTTSQKTIEFSDTITGDNNKLIKREWIVTGSDKFGLPLAYDNDVLLGLFQIAKEFNFSSPVINFSRYQLLKIMGWRDEGNNYKRIEEALDRLRGVSIKAKNAFWDNEKKSYCTVNFGILDSYSLFDSSIRNISGQTTLPFSNVVLNSILYQSIESGYIKNVSLKLYFSLKSVITKRLYRYLDKKHYNKRKFEINLFTLASAHMGLAKCQYSSHIKEKLDPAHEELIKVGYLKSAEYMPTADGCSEKVVYIFGKKIFSDDKLPINSKQPFMDKSKGNQDRVGEDTPEKAVIKILTTTGITELVANQLVKDYPLNKIEVQIKALPFRKANNPAGMLVSAIQEDWAVPNEYVKKVKKEKQDKIDRQKQQIEEKEKAERRKKIENYIDSLPDCDNEKLTEEAKELAKQSAGVYFADKPVPEFLLKSYTHIIVEKRLGLE